MSTEIFNKRVYGCAIIKSLNANYNADFTKQPRTLPNGNVYATDKALKYTIRNFLYKNYAWNLDKNSKSRDKILYFTRNKPTINTGQFVPMSLRELYVYLFDEIEKVNTSGASNPKWMFFYFDGTKVIGKLPKIKPSEIKKYFQETEDSSYSNQIQEAAKNSNEKLKLTDGNITGVPISEEEPFYFYVKGENEIVKIEIEEDAMESIIKDLDLQFFGGYNKIKILYNLLNCLDVRLFGATYTGDTNVSVHGPVQINHGTDRFLYKGANQNLSYTEQIKSPVRNDKAKGGEAEMTTIGTSSKTMEAHYAHSFSINPKNLEDHIINANQLNRPENPEKDKYPLQVGLMTADIQKLKEALRCGATLYDSTSKAGVENEMLVWVELISGSKQVLPNFTELISVTRNEANDKVSINLTRVAELLKQTHIDSHIEKVRIYFNPVFTETIGICETDKVKFKPIELEELKKEENE